MATKKDLVIVILATFCLALTLFTVLPTHSSAGAASEYDPWADINDDGKIDLKDIGYAARLFGTYGDPTKSVTVNDNWTEGNSTFSLSFTDSQTYTIPVGGFKTATFTIFAETRTGFDLSLDVGWLTTGSLVDHTSILLHYYETIISLPGGEIFYRYRYRSTFDVTSSAMAITIQGNGTLIYPTTNGTFFYHLNT